MFQKAEIETTYMRSFYIQNFPFKAAIVRFSINSLI